MSTTTITQVVNASPTHAIYIYNVENPNDTGGINNPTRLGPGETFPTGMWIPWCAKESDFPFHMIIISIDQGDTTFGPNLEPGDFAIWQANEADGDHVRVSADGYYHYTGFWAPGDSAVGGNRRIIFPNPKAPAGSNTLYFEAV